MAIKTIQELLDMKINVDAKRAATYTIHLEDADMDVSYKLASRTEIIQAQKMGAVDIDPYIIFTHIVEPNLADKELQKGYGMVAIEPYKIVDKILNRLDLAALSLAIIGEKQKDLTGEVKN